MKTAWYRDSSQVIKIKKAIANNDGVITCKKGITYRFLSVRFVPYYRVGDGEWEVKYERV